MQRGFVYKGECDVPVLLALTPKVSVTVLAPDDERHHAMPADIVEVVEVVETNEITRTSTLLSLCAFTTSYLGKPCAAYVTVNNWMETCQPLMHRILAEAEQLRPDNRPYLVRHAPTALLTPTHHA